MAAYVNESRVRGPAAWGVVGIAALALALLLGIELVAPPDVTLGALVLVMVVIASLILDERRVVVIVALAVASRAVTAALGDISPGLAALEISSFLVVAGAALASRRALAPSAAKPAEATPARAQTGPPSRGPNLEATSLTMRERQVLQMAMQGLTAAQVAERLYISKRTVETHLERAYAKLGVRSKRQLIASAFDEARSVDRS